MLALSLLASILAVYIWRVGFTVMSTPAADVFHEFVRYFYHNAWLLLVIAVPIFALNGFYSYGRTYQGRYKAIIVAEATAVAYLILAALAFVAPASVTLPPSVLLVAAFTTVVVLVASRFWASLWRHVIKAEAAPPVHATVKQPETVLLIGGAGYIGSALLPKLLAENFRVKVFDLFLYGLEPIQPWIEHPNVELVHADFRQVDALVEAMRGVDRVVHLGGIVGDPACAIDEALTIDVNLAATRVIAEVAKGQGVRRLVFASTCSVYGASDELLDERSRLNPVSLYARSKIASEKVLLEMSDERFLPVIVRFGTIYGLSGRTRFDLVVNLLAAKAVLDGEITVFGGSQWRPFLHVDDAALAVAMLLRRPAASRGEPIFNVGSNAQNYTIGQIGRLIHAKVPHARLIEQGDDGDRRNYRVRFDKIANMVGFRPRWTVEEGIDQVVAAIRAGQITDYHDSRYSNAKFLTSAAGSRLPRRSAQWAQELIHGMDLQPPLPAGAAAALSHRQQAQSSRFDGSWVPAATVDG
jgi:nucleoside-diphosphate-sugar epimerase